jgi:hypothetical protein
MTQLATWAAARYSPWELAGTGSDCRLSALGLDNYQIFHHGLDGEAVFLTGGYRFSQEQRASNGTS